MMIPLIQPTEAKLILDLNLIHANFMMQIQNKKDYLCLRKSIANRGVSLPRHQNCPQNGDQNSCDLFRYRQALLCKWQMKPFISISGQSILYRD